jgi:nicotinate dehydrogenase subunit A
VQRACGNDRVITLDVNGKDVAVDAIPLTSLRRLLRDAIGLNGPKYGCGMAPSGGVHGVPRWRAGAAERTLPTRAIAGPGV